MSDEYHDNGQYKGSLVQESVKDTMPIKNGNYPPPGDTTSEGGYGGDSLSQSSQRGVDNTKSNPPSSEASQNSPQSRNSLGSFGISKSQAAEGKSNDHPGIEKPDPAVGYADRRGESYESAAAGTVYSTDIDS